jgi:hypothetical protein
VVSWRFTIDIYALIFGLSDYAYIRITAVEVFGYPLQTVDLARSVVSSDHEYDLRSHFPQLFKQLPEERTDQAFTEG